MSLLYTFQEYDPEACKSYIIKFFRILFFFFGGHKTLIPEATKLVFFINKVHLLSILRLDYLIITQMQKNNKYILV